MVPSYAAYFIGTTGKSGLRAGFFFGAWAATGVAVVFLVVAAGLYLLRKAIRIDSATLSSSATYIGLAVGVAFTALGLLVVVGRGPSWSPKLNRVLERNRKGMLLWGVLFSIGSLGCSLPLSLAAMALAINAGVAGPLIVASYAAGLAGLVLVAGIVLGLAGPRLGRLMARSVRPIQAAMGFLLIAGGLYVTWYYGHQVLPI